MALQAKKSKSEMTCPDCNELMIRSAATSGNIQVTHYPGKPGLSRTATFDEMIEISIEGMEFSRDARRKHSNGRLFMSRCLGSCLCCGKPFEVYRVVQTSSDLPREQSAVDFQHGYHKAEIFDGGGLIDGSCHLLSDVFHHHSYYSYWLECWVGPFSQDSKAQQDLSKIVDAAIQAESALPNYPGQAVVKKFV